MTLPEFLELLRVAADKWPFGYEYLYYRQPDERGNDQLLKRWSIMQFRPKLRSLNPVEAVCLQMMLSKRIPPRPVIHPLDAAICIGMTADLCDEVTKAAAQTGLYNKKLRKKLLRTCRVGVKQFVEVSLLWSGKYKEPLSEKHIQ